jgi:DnaJ-class molecular chaperone
MKRGGFQGIPGGAEGVDLGDLFAQMFGGGGPGRQGGGRGGRPGVEYRVYSGGGGGFPGGMGGFPGGMGGMFDAFAQEGPRARRRAPDAAPPRQVVHTAPDGTRLVQKGADVHSDVRLQYDQAVLGAVVDVATLTGKASVRIPPGTSSGVKLRLKGKGARGPSGETGDHLVTVQIDVPRQLDDDSKKLLAELMHRIRRKP